MLKNLFLLPLVPSLGAGKLKSGVNIKVAEIKILPLVWDLVRTVVAIRVDVVHHSYRGQRRTSAPNQNIFTVTQPINTARYFPHQVVDYWVGVVVWCDELPLVSIHPERDEVLPE